MSDTAALAGPWSAWPSRRAEFLAHYIFSTDHKMIGRQFLFVGFLDAHDRRDAGDAGALAIGLAGNPGSGVGLHLEPYPVTAAIIPPKTYNALFTMHATIMIFFVVMPIMVGSFGNFLISADDRRRRHGFPQTEHVSRFGSARLRCRDAASFFVPAGRRRRAGRSTRRYPPGRSTPASSGASISGLSA